MVVSGTVGSSVWGVPGFSHRLANFPPLVGIHYNDAHPHYFYHPHRNHPSAYKSTNWIKRYYRVPCRVYMAWKTGRKHARQDLRIYGNVKGITFRSRSQVRPLHESPSSGDVSFSAHRYYHQEHCGIGYSLTDALLIEGVTTWLINSVTHFCDMKKNTNGFTCPGLNVFFRATIIWGVFHSLITYLTLQGNRPGPHFQSSCPIRCKHVVLLNWSTSPDTLLFCKEEMAQLLGEMGQYSSIFLGNRDDTPCNPTPLHQLVRRRVIFPRLHSLTSNRIFFNGWVMTRNPAWWAKYNYILVSELLIYSGLPAYGRALVYRSA